MTIYMCFYVVFVVPGDFAANLIGVTNQPNNLSFKRKKIK